MNTAEEQTDAGKVIVTGISKSYKSRKLSHVVLDNVGFSLKDGEFVSLLGPSGCGKTTLLAIMAGFISPDSGTIRLEGRDVRKPGPDRAFVFQNYALFPWMTVERNIAFPMFSQGLPGREREERLGHLLSLARLEKARYLYPHQLSGGMKQRAAIVRALAGRPAVLLMDEPLGAVDYQMRHELQEELEHMFQEGRVTVIMVTHDVEEAVFMSDRVLLMSRRQGKIVGDVRIELQRPRNRDDETYNRYVQQIRRFLKSEAEDTGALADFKNSLDSG